MNPSAVLLIAMVSWFVLVAGTAAAALTVLVRHNRPVPSQRSSAPVWWLAAPTPSAYLHRRVVRSARGVQRARAMRHRHGGPTVVDELAARFEEQAVALDDRLALAATLPRRERRNELVAVHVRVRRAEEVAAEVRETAARDGGRGVIVGPGCVIDPSTPEERLELVHKTILETVHV